VRFVSSNDLLLQVRGLRQLTRVLPRKLSRYKNLDILGSYAILENIKENDFCEKPARFEDKVRDVVAPVHGDQWIPLRILDCRGIQAAPSNERQSR
jgi:hypothetical protein